MQASYAMPPPPSYVNTTHTAAVPPVQHMLHSSREEMLEGRIVALTKENERLKQEAFGKSHSRTSSMGGLPPQKSPAHPSEGPSTPHLAGPRKSEDDMLSMSNSHFLPQAHGSGYGELSSSPGDFRYNQLYHEYRRVCQELSNFSRTSGWRGGNAPPPPPPNGDFGPSAVAYWSHNTGVPPAPGVQSPQQQGAGTPTHPAPSSSAPPQSPKILPQASPTTRGPAKLSAPPASSQTLKKVSKKQQEVNAENMSKDAYITHLERLLQQKDESLSKFEGRGPEMLDSAVQATVWTVVARTQTDEDGGDAADASSSSSANDISCVDGKGLLLDARQMLAINGFTTLRPLTLQLIADPLITASGSGVQSSGSMSPPPRWQHRPYALTKKRSCGQISNESNPIVELADVPSGSLRWADEPCDLDLAPPTPQIDRRNASLSGAGASTSSLRGDSQSNHSSRGGAAWRGGRAAVRPPVAQTL